MGVTDQCPAEFSFRRHQNPRAYSTTPKLVDSDDSAKLKIRAVLRDISGSLFRGNVDEGMLDLLEALESLEEDYVFMESLNEVIERIWTRNLKSLRCICCSNDLHKDFEEPEIVFKLKRRLHMESQERQLIDKERLDLKIEKQYPNDVGVISAFFFNYVKLNPGEALYLGLTSKPLDIQSLCSMLSYKLGFPEILKGSRIRPYVTRYLPPF